MLAARRGSALAPLFTDRYKQAAELACGLLAVCAAAAFLGWALGLPLLRHFGAGLPAGSPAMALGAMLVACGLLAELRRLPQRRRIVLASSALSAALAAFSLGENLLIAPDLGMWEDWRGGLSGAITAGQLSHSGSLALLVLSAAPIVMRRTRLLFGVALSSILAAALLGIAFVALIGLVYRLLQYDSSLVAPLLSISLPDALMLLFGGLALLLARPGQWFLQVLHARDMYAMLVRWLLPAAVVLPTVLGGIHLFYARSGLFDQAKGMALLTLLMILLLGGLVLGGASTLRRLELRRARAEDDAQEQRKWLQVTIASIADGVIAADSGGRVRFMNRAAERLTGWPAGQATGRPLSDLVELLDESTGVPVENAFEHALAVGCDQAALGEPVLRRRDGTTCAVDLNCAPIMDGAHPLGAVFVLRDVSARRESERALREAYADLDRRVMKRTAALERTSTALRQRNRLLNAIMANTPDLIFVQDRWGRMLMANAAYLRMVNRKERDIVGRTHLDLIANPEEAQHIVNNDRAVLHSGEGATFEEVLSRPDGPHTYLTTKSPLRDDAGDIIGLVGIATDITELKRAQQELESLVLAEHRLRAEAERANRAKDEFLAVVSHELRSPLNALRGWTHLLGTAARNNPELTERAVRAIQRSVDNQTRLIDDLLDTSRIMSGKLTIERRLVNLVEIVQAALEGARPLALEKRISLRFSVEAKPVSALGDAGRLQQLVSNLLSNAVKFTPEGGAVDIVLSRTEDQFRLAVSDNGIGIPAEFLPHLFERFSQADSSSTRRAGGLGIGLALVRHIADLHGGKVRVQSAGEGQGATFTAELPVPTEKEAELLASGRMTDEIPSGQPSLAGVSVCLVDDDADSREVLELMLRQAGARVESRDSGRAFLSLLEHRLEEKDRPDALLVDLAMPGEDGYSVLANVRALEAERGTSGKPLPALAVTAFTMIDRARFTASGFAEVLLKPVDPAKLVVAIRAAMEKQDGRKRAA